MQNLEKSIANAKDKLAKGLLQPAEASQLSRMILYYEDKLRAQQASK